jgi:hypothetical protein
MVLDMMLRPAFVGTDSAAISAFPVSFFAVLLQMLWHSHGTTYGTSSVLDSALQTTHGTLGASLSTFAVHAIYTPATGRSTE